MQKIHVKNFKAIKDMEIELDKALLLIGEQASGKSTISKLIYFFKSLRQDFIDLIFENLDGDETQLHPAFISKIREKFYNYFGSTRYLHPHFYALYTYAETKYIKLSLDPYDKKSLKVVIPAKGKPDFFKVLFRNDKLQVLIQNARQYANPQNAHERREFQRVSNDLEAYINQIFNDSCTPSFIPAGRNITVNYPEQFKLYSNLQSDLAYQQKQEAQSIDLYLMLRFLDQAERMKRRFQASDFETLITDRANLGALINEPVFALVQERIHKILKGKYTYDQHGEKLYIKDNQSKEEQFVHLRDASSGQQEAIRILQDIFLILLDGDDVFRVIEEPEAHLYPMAQKHLMELIAIVLNESDSQIIMTTHSPYILSIINNLLFATEVARKNSEPYDEISSILPKACWLNPDVTNVYFLKNGTCRSVFDKEVGLIDQNSLDGISEDLGADFEELYDIYVEQDHG